MLSYFDFCDQDGNNPASLRLARALALVPPSPLPCRGRCPHRLLTNNPADSSIELRRTSTAADSGYSKPYPRRHDCDRRDHLIVIARDHPADLHFYTVRQSLVPFAGPPLARL